MQVPQDKLARGHGARSDHIAALERGLAIVKLLAASEDRLTLAEVAQQSGYSRAAARRFLLSLQGLGFVVGDGRYFRLNRDVLELGFSYLSSQPWWRPALHAIAMLSSSLGANCAAGVLDRGQFAIVARPTSHRVSVAGPAGVASMPAYASAGGRVLLGALSPDAFEGYIATAAIHPLTHFTLTSADGLRRAVTLVRESGHAVAAQEIEIGITAVAVPIRDRGGKPVAALEAYCRGMDGVHPEAVIAALKEAADAIHLEAFNG